MEFKHSPRPQFIGEAIISVNRSNGAQHDSFQRLLKEYPTAMVVPHVYINDSALDMLVEVTNNKAFWIRRDGQIQEANVPDGGMCRGNPTVAACIAGGGGCRRSYACNE